MALIKHQYPPATLALEDGTCFSGRLLTRNSQVSGEVVFNTALTGYQEILTDPSYCGQIVTLTYPHIGNTGVNDEDKESEQIFASGLIVRDVPNRASSYRAENDLVKWLDEHDSVAITDIDTRALTHHLRDHGAQNGCIVGHDVSQQDAMALAKAAPPMLGRDLTSVVTTKEIYQWVHPLWQGKAGQQDLHVVVMDFGVKQNILRHLVSSGCRVTVVPALTSAEDIVGLAPDGILLSNGPGDPDACLSIIDSVKRLLATQMPLFGICLGHQILALACGAKTVKMKFGHHGANHPVKALENSQVFITSQNHGFAVDEKSLPSALRATHVSLFDGSLQGFECVNHPAYGFQGHPEASPGPHDISPLFERFTQLMQMKLKKRSA